MDLLGNFKHKNNKEFDQSQSIFNLFDEIDGIT